MRDSSLKSRLHRRKLFEVFRSASSSWQHERSTNMALSTFPRPIYKRLLRAAKTIDDSSCKCALQTILCGKPSSLYSYQLKVNVDIGNASYSMYDEMISILNDGEYSSPMHSYTLSFYSMVRNTARLCSDKGIDDFDHNETASSMFTEYCRGMVLSKAQLLEIASNFEALASIAMKQTGKRSVFNAITAYSPRNTFQCQTMELNEQMTDQEFIKKIKNMIDGQRTDPIVHEVASSKENPQKLENKKKKKRDPVLEFVPRGLQDIYKEHPSSWRNSLLFQHPLSTMSRFSMNGNDSIIDIRNKIEPHVLLGLHAESLKSKVRLSRSWLSSFCFC